MSVLDFLPDIRLLHVLVVDTEPHARSGLAQLLRDDLRVAEVLVAGSAVQALRVMVDHHVDVIFCEITMQGFDGVELARVASRFAQRPQIVFVTTRDDRASEAFELHAADYLMKPVRPDRLAEAVRRVTSLVTVQEPGDDETIAVELGGVTRFIHRSTVRYVEAQGDYARLHTTVGSNLVRTPLAVLELRWAAAGFVRIHRSTLVAIAHVQELRLAGGHYSVAVGDVELPVSRRHARDVRERLMHG
ncbi:MAG: LytTR family DNA-binding domain-containing protein [Actinomycetota bacterium]|nr:LytTR family DNA-binding domain-containing protein [Actinomycetota bacterium]